MLGVWEKGGGSGLWKETLEQPRPGLQNSVKRISRWRFRLGGWVWENPESRVQGSYQTAGTRSRLPEDEPALRMFLLPLACLRVSAELLAVPGAQTVLSSMWSSVF